jgi:hypothetical protein
MTAATFNSQACSPLKALLDRTGPGFLSLPVGDSQVEQPAKAKPAKAGF